MSLKDDIANDNLNTFMNIDEFAETIDINNYEVKAIFEPFNESEQVKFNTSPQDSFNAYRGLNKSYYKLYIETETLNKLNLSVAEQISINSKPYYVETIAENFGLTEVLVSQLVGR